jgi:DNA-binding response OmpR family regulator
MQPRILVIEDDINLNRLYTRKLSATSYQVDSVYSVNEAIRYLEDGNVPMLVILDMNLPDGSGSFVMDHLNRDIFRKTRVIVVSGEAYSRHHVMDSRQPDYELLKPISPRMLSVLAHQVINEAVLLNRQRGGRRMRQTA